MLYNNYRTLQRQRQQKLLSFVLPRRLFNNNTATTTTTTTTRLHYHNDTKQLSYSNIVRTSTSTTIRQCQQKQQQLYQQQLSSCSNVFRSFHTSMPMKHGGTNTKFPDGTPQVSLTFIDPKKADGKEEVTVKAYVGDNLLRVAHKNHIDLEGACEGACACSTCHVILEEEIYDKCEEPSEDEEDMLDMAFDLQETSRLGCQIIVSKEMDHTTITLPSATRNFYVDGHIPKPH